MLAIAIPAGFLSDVSHLRDKTVKVGVIGRAAAIFRVDEILVYLDRREFERDGEFICQILRFMDVPQYLRKRLFDISSSLKYTGLLPPLRTPPHTVESKLELAGRDRFREGVVSFDLSGLSDGHRVVVSYYLMHALFPFVFGVSDVFLDYARHSSSPRFVYYSPITNVDRLYAKSQADYIIVLTRDDATLYLPYRVGDKAGFAELRFQPLWRVVKG